VLVLAVHAKIARATPVLALAPALPRALTAPMERTAGAPEREHDESFPAAVAPQVQRGEHRGGVHMRCTRPAPSTSGHSRVPARGWTHTAINPLTVLLRIAWRTVAATGTRVVADGRDTSDLLSGTGRDRYRRSPNRKGTAMTVVVDHDTGRLVWAPEGRNQDALGPGRSRRWTKFSRRRSGVVGLAQNFWM
jgi:hypothetical protein